MTDTTNPCGTCTMCCKLLGVEELAKPSCVWCPKVDKRAGCTDYDNRPSACRDFECVWLQSQYRRMGESALPMEMRPDHSRVVIDVRRDAHGLVFHVDPDRPHAHEQGPVSKLLASCMRRGEAVVVVLGKTRKLLTPTKQSDKLIPIYPTKDPR